jgi:hypothetical protein
MAWHKGLFIVEHRGEITESLHALGVVTASLMFRLVARPATLFQIRKGQPPVDTWRDLHRVGSTLHWTTRGRR